VLWKLAPVELPGDSLHEAASTSTVPLLLMWLLVGLVATSSTIVVAIVRKIYAGIACQQPAYLAAAF